MALVSTSPVGKAIEATDMLPARVGVEASRARLVDWLLVLSLVADAVLPPVEEAAREIDEFVEVEVLTPFEECMDLQPKRAVARAAIQTKLAGRSFILSSPWGFCGDKR